MRNAVKIILTILVISLLSVCACKNETPVTSADIKYETSGPDSGSLVIVGGNMKDSSIINRFIELAGGKDAQMIVIPTASGEKEIDTAKTTEILTSAGAMNVTVLHTYDTIVANSEEFVAPLRKARGVWFNGGRQWRLVDAYANTLAEKEILKVLARGGVIGGSSAGATIQGSYLVRGDTKTNTVMMGDHELGFAYLKNSAIDQHLLVRNRQNDLPSVITKYPNLLGLGLDENTAIVVKGNEFEVIGQSFVAIYDYNLWQENPAGTRKLQNGAKFFLLRKGDRYNVKSREVTRWGGDPIRNIFPDSSARR
ncbi:MAG: cyanophycinase [Odoribacter sp.]|nr:cyanophycinase [Odoribacter sp.]